MMTDGEKQAVADYDCPFCGAKAGHMCVRVEATYETPLPLSAPHLSRVVLLTEPERGFGRPKGGGD